MHAYGAYFFLVTKEGLVEMITLEKVSKEQRDEMKQILKNYYRIEKQIADLKQKELFFLTQREQAISEWTQKIGELSSNNISLEVVIPSPNGSVYAPKLKNNIQPSLQEQAIESAYKFLEKEIENLAYKIQSLEDEIINNKNKIHDLKMKQIDISIIIDNHLNGEEQYLLEQMYLQKKTCASISVERYCCQSTIKRKKDRIVEKVYIAYTELHEIS